MSISYPSGTSRPIAAVNARDQAISINSSEIMLANTSRAGGTMLVNNTNKAIWIRLGDNQNPAIKNNSSSFAIPANGGNYTLPDHYLGAVQGLLDAVAVGTLQIVEPNY
ncbi:hypothetical protein [Chamaesiphon sp. OTE_75_metabat_556]|uniref:hypothetical protein n=1 Tax=Chamaesiphon sp. OTE_75_metabat_556 TaxID=2964692 RepID=UPI00286B1C3B|nr:hypothetical protein [Chamaesiphon sp. OTE_75_metabat_556]